MLMVGFRSFMKRSALVLAVGGIFVLWTKGTAMSEPAKPEPKRFELVANKDVDIGGGVRVRLKYVMEAHLEGSRNELRMTFAATRDGKTQEVNLDRLLPGVPSYVAVLGRKVAIDYVDAYHQPSTGAILVLQDSGP